MFILYTLHMNSVEEKRDCPHWVAFKELPRCGEERKVSRVEGNKRSFGWLSHFWEPAGLSGIHLWFIVLCSFKGPLMLLVPQINMNA